MLAGVHDPTGRGNARLQALPGTRHRRLGPLSVAWDASVDVAEADGLVVWVDGFLLGSVPHAAAIVAAWPAGATAALARMRGAFTVVIWDARRGALTIANDHMSLRACLVHRAGATTTLATDSVALRAVLPKTPGADDRVLAAWVAPLNSQGHATMLDGVERVGAGRLVEVSAREWRRQCYWDPQYRPSPACTIEEAADGLRTHLDAAIALRMDDERPTAVVLSGGLDSTVVASLAATAHGPEAIRAYSATFPAWPRADEAERIRATRTHLGIAGRTFAVRAQGGVRLAIEVIRASGLPPAGPGAVVELAPLRQAARDGLRVVLDGQGGDEIFGLSPFLLADRLRTRGPYGALKLLHRLVDLRDPSLRRQAAEAGWRYGVGPQLGVRFERRREWRAFHLGAPLRPEHERALHADHDPLVWREQSEGPLWWRYQRFRLVDGREQGGLSEYLWQRGVGSGLRSPAPLMDPDLVEHVLGTDPAPAWARTDRPVARRAARDALPPVVRANRVKANLGPFYLDMMSGADAEAIDALLSDPGARIRALVDPARLAEHTRRRPTMQDASALPWATARWRMLVAELWLRWLEDPASLDGIAAPEPLADD